MSEQPIISFQSVRKDFGPVRAVNDVSFDILTGEFFSLLGPSGCGKTTLLRMVAGFEAPTGGEIYLDGQPLSAIPPHQRPVNMVFQSYAIFPHLNVSQNIAFGLRKSGLSKQELDSKINEMLEMIKLPGFGSRGADELSGGQRQRVALARALIKRPKVLLLDEPLGALDKKLREQMQIELRALQQQVGITFVFVTHDQEEALTLSDRIAVMSKGDVLEIASPTELYESPRTQFVADFIGTMNFFKGSVRSVTDATTEVEAESLGTILAGAGGNGLSAGSEVMVAIRPEKLELCFESPQVPENTVEGRMGPSAYLGDRSHLYVLISGREEPVSVALQNLDRSSQGSRHTDQPVWLSWSKDSVVLLPVE
ncbi:MAG: ABC transporter ATP-binding protein [Gammaproteobacteria bacterium]|nr:ABC transporter ATP-binding protein [Gammaproteobacteria bacterium]